jgi:PilZ domain
MSRVGSRYRRTTRHRVGTFGQCVRLDDFRLIGERILDASAEGVLVACDAQVRTGERVLLSFPVGERHAYFDAEAEVVRVIEGHRDGDPGYCAGLRFVDFERSARLAMGVDLRRYPEAPRHVRWSRPQ